MELYKKHPVLCTIWAFMEVVLFGGVIFGWGSLVFILKEEGFYLDSCEQEEVVFDSGFILPEHLPLSNRSGAVQSYRVEKLSQSANNLSISSVEDNVKIERNDEDGCAEQKSKLNLWFSVAVSFMYLAFTGIGYLIKLIGTRYTRSIFFIIYLIGTMCLAFASPDIPWLLLPGLCCIGTGGLVVLATNLQVSYLHPKLRSTIVAIFTGLFDFSSINKQLIRIAFENGISRRTSYFIFSSIFGVIIAISTFFFLPKKGITEEDILKTKSTESIEVEVPSKEEEIERLHSAGKALLEQHDEDEKFMEKHANGHVSDFDKAENKTPLLKANEGNFVPIAQDGVLQVNPVPFVAAPEKTPSLCATLLSLTFILHLYWLFVHALRFVTFIGQLNIWLDNIYKNDYEKVGQSLAVFSYMTMGAIGTALFCGFVYDYQRKRYAGASKIKRVYLPVILPMALVILYSISTTVMCYISHTVAPYFAFVMFTFFRSSLFTVAVAFIGDAFPSEYFGVLFGFLQCSAGIAGLVQYPLFQWYDAYFGSYIHVNILLLALQVSTLIHPVILFIRGRRDSTDVSNNPYRQEYTVNVPSIA